MSVNQPGDVAYGFSQSLIGVPSKPILAQRSPTTNDKAQIGTTWINQVANEVYVITSIVDNVANWVQTDSSSAFNQVDADVGSATPNMGVLNAFGGANINTSAAGNTLTINLNDNVDLPATNAGGTQGVYQIGGVNFLFGYGPTNSFVGGNAGNTSLTPLSSVRNVGVGNNTINSLTTGANNTALGAEALTTANTALNNVAVGYLSLTALTSGESNTALGNQSLQNLVTGEDNIAIGFAAGSALNGAQSSNIYLGSPGVITDANIMRLGDEGGGPGQIQSTYVAGVYPTNGLGPVNSVVFVADDGLMGTFPSDDGEIIIGETGGSPAWATITPGTNINIINGPNSIEIESTVPQAIEDLLGDNAQTASGQTVNLVGGDNITTAGDNADTMTIAVSGTTNHAIQVGNAAGSLTSLAAATNGQIPIGSTGANPTVAAITPGTNINITNGAGSITIDCTVDPAIETLNGDTGSATGSTVTVTGAQAGGTVNFSGAGSTLTLNVTSAPLHNTFIGLQAGNGTVSMGGNTALGYRALTAVDTGQQNTAIGFGAMLTNDGGNYNTAVGYGALGTGIGLKNTAIGNGALATLDTGGFNTCLGYFAGASYNSGEDYNICIGTDVGGTAGEDNVCRIGAPGNILSCFIQGIGGVTPGGTPEFVIIDPATGELGSTSAGGSGIATLDGDSGSATGSTVTLDAATNCGSSASFSATGSTVSLNITDLVYNNIILGNATGNLTGTGSLNTVIGQASMAGFTTAASNTGMGNGVFTNLVSSDQNTAFGLAALGTLATGSGQNTAIGFAALGSSIDGTNNIGVGHTAGTNWTGSESNNIAIGTDGVLGDSGVIRLGDFGIQTSCFIQGIDGVTVVGANPVVIGATGEMGTIVSSRRYKDNISELEDESQRILELRPVKFNYKNDTTRETHYGLIAEEVEGVFPDLVNYNRDGAPESVRYHELPALLINEIQRQNATIADLLRRLERLETRGSYESKA